MNGHQRSDPGGDAVGRPRLVTWKAIAAYLGRDEKTVRRWEIERGLPVHRAPGEARSTVYASPAELDSWLRSGSQAAEPVPEPEPAPPVQAPPSAAEPAPSPRRTRARAGGMIAAAILLAVGGWQVAERVGPARGAEHRASTRAQALDLQGLHQWNLRTPESLARAVDLFTQAIVQDPQDARAYAGLADCYNLLREYSVLPAAEAFPRAEAAARRAVALDPRLAGAHASLAFVLAWWRWDAKQAEAEFRRALALDPRSAKAWHWRATWRLGRGEIGPALADIERAQALAPESDAIVADRALILFSAGRQAEAGRILRGLETERPDFQSPHAYLAEIHMARKDWPAWLGEVGAAAHLRHAPEREAMAKAGRDGLAADGEPGMWRAILAEQEPLGRAGRLSSLELGAIYALAGRREAALKQVAAGVAAHEIDAVSLPNALAYASLRGDPDFVRLVRPTGLGGAPPEPG